jgi:aspartyl-tRNA(Asn)/glutamyl-tRNA(Gln) amidotransferase subunit A
MGAAAAGALLATTRAAAQGRGDELTRLSIVEASRRIAAREISPVELTRAYLERIETIDGRVNAYITVTAEQVLEQARVLERELVAGRSRGALHGIPIGLKDNIDTAGVLTTAGSAVYADRVPAEDARVVTLLRDAGAVFLGKLNMHEFA